jgi:hypothetical protein
MAAITQLVPNFLGGVSRQNDDKKLQGQVSECINGYPDPTYGLLKRPGMKYIDKLKDSGGNPFNKAALDGAIWTYIDRGANGSYVAAIKGTNVYAWTTDTGTWCTVTNTGTGYLTGTTSDHYHFRSIQDTTIVTNRSVVTAMGAPGTFVANSVATLRLISLVSTYNYTVTIQGIDSVSTAQNSTTFDDMLIYDSGSINTNHHMVDDIVNTITTQQAASNTDFSGTWCIEGYTNSLVIKRFSGTNQVLTNYENTNGTFTGTPLAFTIEAKGGFNNDSLEVFEDEVIDVSKLPIESFQGHHVTILNSDTDADDYYVEYVAYNGEKGRGYWKEAVARDVAVNINASTMPHALINTGATSFTFGPITWNDRLTGDDVTNPQPSFIGKTINASFYYNNRFGVLSEDNIIMGVANDAYNFFAKSALTQIDSDPIDVNVSSVRPVTLSDVLPSPQGLVVFSGKQQFIVLATETGVLTPSTTVVRTLASYELDTNISPVDVGTTFAFINKVSGYSKLFYMQLRGIEETPTVVDISKIVLEWIPNTIDDLIVSPQNSLIALIDRQSSYIYIYRFYNNGQEDVMTAWTKWELTGTIQSADIIGDDFVVVSQHEDEYTLNTITLDELPTGEVTATVGGSDGNPCLDFATRPFDYGSGAVIYDSTNDVTQIYTPFTPISGKKGTVLIADPSIDAGYSFDCVAKTDGSGNPYFEVAKDLTDLENGMVIGYNYNYEVTLPKFYFRQNEQQQDFTANLTIARAKVSVGRTGTVTFKTKLTNSKQWIDVKEVTSVETYGANDEPVKPEFQFVVPIHQRNINFELQVTSNQPYPVSLVSMMWEGNYSPRYYRRT